MKAIDDMIFDLQEMDTVLVFEIVQVKMEINFLR